MFRLFLGAVCIGFAPIFVKLLSLGPSAIGFYRCAFAALFLFIYIFCIKRDFHLKQLSAEVWKYIVLAGLLFGLDLFVWHRSVIFAGAGMGTILGNTQVFYVALIGVFIHKERVNAIFLFSVLMAFLGIYLLVNYQIASEALPQFKLGVIFGLATGMVYCCYILTMRKLESFTGSVPREQILALVSSVAAVFLFFTSLGEGSFRLPEGAEWTNLLLLAFIAQVMGWLLITKNLRLVPVSRAGLIINAQPVIAVFAGYFILGEHLSTVQVGGAALTLGAIYLGTLPTFPHTKLHDA